MIISDELIGMPATRTRVVKYVTGERTRDPLIAIAVRVMAEGDHDVQTAIYFYADNDLAADHAYHVVIRGARGQGLRITSRNENETRALMDGINAGG